MRVALAFPGCHRRGGVERVMFECARFLGDRGHEVHAFAAEIDGEALGTRVQAHAVSVPRAARLVAFGPRARRAVDELRPAPEVLATFGVTSPRGGVIWAQSVHRAWLEVSHRLRPLPGRLKQRVNPAHPILLALENRCYARRQFRHVIALTEQVKADLARFYAVPAEDMTVIPNGFSPAEFSMAARCRLRDQARRQLGYGPHDKVILFAANELARKGFDEVAAAMARLQDADIRLLVVGRAATATTAHRMRRLGLADRVRFLGPVDEMARCYSAADVLALPTQYEAWGLVVIEALACGLPVVTSRVAGAAVAVNEGETGSVLDDPRDSAELAVKLRAVLDGSHAAPERIASSVASYAWPNLLETYEHVLQRFASHP